MHSTLTPIFGMYMVESAGFHALEKMGGMLAFDILRQQTTYASRFQEQVCKVRVLLNVTGHAYTEEQVVSALRRACVEAEELYDDLSRGEETFVTQRFFAAIRDEQLLFPAYRLPQLERAWSKAQAFKEAMRRIQHMEGTSVAEVQRTGEAILAMAEQPKAPAWSFQPHIAFIPFRVSSRQLWASTDAVQRDFVQYVQWFNAQQLQRLQQQSQP